MQVQNQIGEDLLEWNEWHDSGVIEESAVLSKDGQLGEGDVTKQTVLRSMNLLSV